MKKHTVSPVRRLCVTGAMAAIAVVLMYLEFPVPFMPPFIKFDFSELPALIVSFAFGPLEGIAVCLIKNLVKLPTGMTGGVGELANFLIGVFFVAPAGMLYRHFQSRGGALAGCLCGSCLMAASSLPLNYYVVYPIYAKLMPIEAILAAYNTINPSVDGLFACLLVFNLPFTLIKGLADSLITFLIYKYLSPFLKGTRKNNG